MNFPYQLNLKLDNEQMDTWNNIFIPTRGSRNDKTVEQSLWRRNQTEANKEMSGWTCSEDTARKIVYYKHEYDVNSENYLILKSTYIYICLSLKKEELQKYIAVLNAGIESAGWKKDGDIYRNGGLVLKTKFYEHPGDRQNEYLKFPDNYQTLELVCMSDNFAETGEQKLIWHIAQAGLRKSKKRDNPQYSNDFSKIIEKFPVQLELGCGPSYETGVDPLHVLHDIYSINEPFTKKFIIDAQNDNFFTSLIANPVKTLESTSNFYSKIITCKLSDFYRVLKKLYDKDYVVGPILTNNFDGLHLRLGIPEIFIRTYDEVDVMPEFQFDPRAKALLVIGCHADRRGIERRARERGLAIIYIDPEGWWVDGKFKDYLLESPQSTDLIFKKTSLEAFKALEKAVGF